MHSAKLYDVPAAMLTTVLPASTPPQFTNTGTRELLVLLLPLPSWPYELLPQAASVPSAHSARLCVEPAATATTFLPASTPDKSTEIGTALAMLLLLPHWPELLAPQAATDPSEHSARL